MRFSRARVGAEGRRVLALALAAGALGAFAGLGVPATSHAQSGVMFSSSPAEHPRARTSSTPALSLSGVSPAIATPGQDVRLQVTLHNGTSRAVTPTVNVGVGGRLSTREDVARHAARPSTGLPTIVTSPVSTIAPGARTTVSLTVPADRLTLPRPYGVLPVTLTVTGLPDAGPIATFLPYQVVKEYEPLRLAVALPLTADPDPASLAGGPAERQEARTRMVANGSRLDRILKAADATDATLVADPWLLGTSTTTATTGPTASAAPSAPTDPLPAFGTRVTSTGNDVWLLPPGDPDVSALAAARATRPAGTPRPTPTTLPGATRTPASVLWPAGASGRTVRSAADGSPVPTTVILRESRSDTDPTLTGSAPRQDADGRRVLVTDDRLSADLADVTPQTAPTVSQRALADTVTLLGESPGLSRSYLLLPDRSLDPDPVALSAVVRALQGAPWISSTPARTVLDTAPTQEPVVDPDTPPTGPSSPITTETMPYVEEIVRLADGMHANFGKGQIPDDVDRVATSTRWRGQSEKWTSALATLRARLEEDSQGVSIVPSAVNFFADHGILQVTVVNDLDVEVRDVYLRADVQGRPARLRILSEPEPLTIRPHSRTTVRLDVEAVAAGVVPIRTSLRTAEGVPLGADATVRVQVRPTNGWVVLAGGAVVGVIFLLGLFRAIRLGQRRVADADLRGLDLD